MNKTAIIVTIIIAVVLIAGVSYYLYNREPVTSMNNTNANTKINPETGKPDLKDVNWYSFVGGMADVFSQTKGLPGTGNAGG